jgi:hypothetical protein
MTHRHPLAAGVTLALLWALLALVAPAAHADVFGPDESIAQAGGPLQPGNTYGGAFSSPDDIDYLSFDVTQPNQTLHFDVVNTLTDCNSPDLDFCPMWATLIDGNGQQLGGPDSYAGTGEVDYASSDTIDWTFPSPGRYYLVLDSSGDLPSFQLDFNVVVPGATGGGGGGGGGTGTTTGSGAGAGAGSVNSQGHGSSGAHGGSGTGQGAAGPAGLATDPGALGGAVSLAGPGALINYMSVARSQRGLRPDALVNLSQPLAELDVQVLSIARSGRLSVVGHLVRQRPIDGPERIRVPVRGGAWLSRTRAVPMLFRLRALSLDGRSQVFQRRFTLRR